MPSLSEIRATPPAPRPRRTMEVCLDGAIIAEMQRLDREHQAIQLELMRGQDEGDQPKRPRKLGAGRDPRLVEIDQQVAALDARREAASGVVTLEATPSNTEWTQFADANPPRGEDEPGHDRDAEYAAGRVNVDAVAADLGRYVHAWNDEPCQPGDWERISASMAPAELYDLATLVISMYWARPDFQRARVALSGALTR